MGPHLVPHWLDQLDPRLHSEVNARVSSPSSSARLSLLQVSWRYDALRVGNFHGQLVMVD